MFQIFLKSLRGKDLKMPLSNTLRYRPMSYKNENVIGGGLEKPQGGIKEETYFSEQNNNLMMKIRDHGTIFKNKNSVGNLRPDVLHALNGRTAIRDSCSINKNKNCLEEAFFLNEQTECCAKLSKQDSFQKVETKEKTKTNVEQRNPYSKF